MTDYDNKTNLEINRLVAEKRGGCRGAVGDWMPGGVKALDSGTGFYAERDYCGRWEDAGPVMVEDSISLLQCGGDSWDALHNCYMDKGELCFEVAASDPDPLRAAMICYLMIEENNE